MVSFPGPCLSPPPAGAALGATPRTPADAEVHGSSLLHALGGRTPLMLTHIDPKLTQKFYGETPCSDSSSLALIFKSQNFTLFLLSIRLMQLKTMTQNYCLCWRFTKVCSRTQSPNNSTLCVCVCVCVCSCSLNSWGRMIWTKGKENKNPHLPCYTHKSVLSHSICSLPLLPGISSQINYVNPGALREGKCTPHQLLGIVQGIALCALRNWLLLNFLHCRLCSL